MPLHFLDRHPVLALGLWAIISPAGSTAMVCNGLLDSERSISRACMAMNSAFGGAWVILLIATEGQTPVYCY